MQAAPVRNKAPGLPSMETLDMVVPDCFSHPSPSTTPPGTGVAASVNQQLAPMVPMQTHCSSLAATYILDISSEPILVVPESRDGGVHRRTTGGDNLIPRLRG